MTIMFNRTQPSSFHNQPAALKKRKEKKKNYPGQEQDGSAEQPKFDPQNSHSKNRKTTTLNCPLIYMCVLWNAQYAHTHTHTHTVKIKKLTKAI